jgi:SAM-dependent methyltransferase
LRGSALPAIGHCPVCTAALPSPLLTGRDRLHGLPGTFAVTVCQACGAGASLPSVGIEQLNALYPGTYYAHRDQAAPPTRALLKLYHLWRDRARLRAFPLCELASRPAGRLLDVGCGKGDIGALLAARGWAVTGIDISADACELARSRGLDARAGTLLTVDLPRSSFDAALFHHSLEHVIDPVRELERVRELLEPAGVLVVSLPNFGSWQRRLFKGRWFPLDLPRHRIHLDARALAVLLRRAGFTPVRVSTTSTIDSLPMSIEYVLAGRAFFRRLRRLAVPAYALAYPLTLLANRIGGSGDVLSVVAQRTAV